MEAPWWDFPRFSLGIRNIVQTGVAHGMKASECLADVGLSELPEPGHIVSAHQELCAARNLLRGIGDRPGLGIEAGALSSMADSGPYGLAALTMGTLREALNTAITFVKLTQSFVRPYLRETPTIARLIFDAEAIPADVRNFFVERDISGVVGVVAPAIMGVLDGPLSVTVALEAQRVSLLEELFGVHGHIVTGPENAIRIPQDLLEVPPPTANPRLALVLAAECRSLLEELNRSVKASTQVANLLGYNQASPRSSIFDTALALRMSERTLRRRLAAEGTTFREIAQNVRLAEASNLLRNSGLSVDQIARRTGYSGGASFAHAFTRRFGLTPHDFRRQVEP